MRYLEHKTLKSSYNKTQTTIIQTLNQMQQKQETKEIKKIK
jgi:hypothetical protein